MKKTIWFILSGMTVILGILLVGNILLIGDKIGAVTHLYVEYAFYVVMAFLIFCFILVPVARILLMPEFPKLETEEGWDVRKMRKYGLSLAKNCFYLTDVTERKERRNTLEASIDSAGDDAAALKRVIDDEVGERVRNINHLVSRCGRKVLVLTAASQNSTLDTFSVIILNIRLIYQIVCATGYRPNIFQLSRIMIGVLGSAFTAYISQSLTNSLEGYIKNLFANTGIPILGSALGMLLNGSLNAALTLYIGYATRNYVLKGLKALSNETEKAGVMSSAVSMAAEFMKESFVAKKDAVIDKAGALVLKVSEGGKSFVERIVEWSRKKFRPETDA